MFCSQDIYLDFCGFDESTKFNIFGATRVNTENIWVHWSFAKQKTSAEDSLMTNLQGGLGAREQSPQKIWHFSLRIMLKQA